MTDHELVEAYENPEKPGEYQQPGDGEGQRERGDQRNEDCR
jgi:hypothetical protein